MLLENQWFWLVMIAFFVIMYLIISKVCETIENIKLAKDLKMNAGTKYNVKSNTMSFKSLEELDNFIDELKKFREEIIAKEEENDE